MSQAHTNTLRHNIRACLRQAWHHMSATRGGANAKEKQQRRSHNFLSTSIDQENNEPRAMSHLLASFRSSSTASKALFVRQRSCCCAPKGIASKPSNTTLLFEYNPRRSCTRESTRTIGTPTISSVDGIIGSRLTTHHSHLANFCHASSYSSSSCRRITTASFASANTRELHMLQTASKQLLKQRISHLSSISINQRPQRQMLVQKSLFDLWSTVVQGRFLSTATSALQANGGGGGGTGQKLERNESQDVDKEDGDQILAKDDIGRKQIEIRACGKVYEELRKTRPVLYGGAPVQGIEFNVQYYDSIDSITGKAGPSENNNEQQQQQPVATVCLLHGAPGQYSDFASVIRYLSERGVRVLAPNFPDYNATYEHSFRHSPRERCDFLLEFFKAIKVTKIDMLIGHSSAVYTMFQLLEYSTKKSAAAAAAAAASSEEEAKHQVAIKSLGLFSTPSYRLPRNLAVTPFRLFTLKLFDYPLLRPLILVCIVTFVKLQGIRNRVDRNKIEDLLIAASAVGYSDHEKMAPRLELLKEHKIPSLVIYGTNDRLMSPSAYKKLEEDLGVTNEHTIKCYRGDGSLATANNMKNRGSQQEQHQQQRQLVEVCRFESAGHYAFQRYAKQVNEEVYEFLRKRVLSDQRQPEERETTRL